MNILIIYATYSSGTASAADVVSKTLTESGHTVTMKNPPEITPDMMMAYDIVILASPSWDFEGKEGQPHQDYVQLMELCKDKTFDDKKFAIFGLGDSSYTHFCGAVDVLEEFVKSIHGKLIVSSLRIDGYFFNQDEHNDKLIEWTNSLPLQ